MEAIEAAHKVGGDVTFNNGIICFYYYIMPEGDSKGNYSIYSSLQEELREYGWEIVNPYIEHDCISGELRQYSGEEQ
jgi:hypothetical protein